VKAVNEERKQPVPIYILSGFLGSGKTTLLNQLIDHYVSIGLRPAVLMNEIGEMNIDGAIIGDNVTMKELLNGCICCSIRGDLARALHEIATDVRPHVIFVESTGIANPMEVVDAASDILLADKIKICSIITVVDSPRLLDLTRRLGTKGKTIKMMRGQIQFAAQIILNKIDLLFEGDLDEVAEIVKEINPKAEIQSAVNCKMDVEHLLSPVELSRRSMEHDHQDDGHSHVMVYTHYFNKPVDRIKFEGFLRELPAEILRAKGFVEFTDVPGRFLFQYAYREPLFIRYPSEAEIPMAAVFIGFDLPRVTMKHRLYDIENSEN
jgi:G3E family GTPase